MSNTVPAEIVDLSKLMPLTKAQLQSGVYEYLIAQISPVIVLDCRPAERSYVWMGEGMVDRNLEKMPDLAPLIEDHVQEAYEKRLQNHTKWSEFSLVDPLMVDTEEKCLRLYRPRRVDLRNKTGPLLKSSGCTSTKITCF